MSERDIVQSILRNCNPRLASLLRGAVKDVAELLRSFLYSRTHPSYIQGNPVDHPKTGSPG